MAVKPQPIVQRLRISQDIHAALNCPHPITEYLTDLSSGGGLEYIRANIVACERFLRDSRVPHGIGAR